MRHLLILMLTVLMLGLYSCGPTKTIVETTPTEYEYMFNEFESVFTYHQLDSICFADSISNDIRNDWHEFNFVDYETKTVQTQYSYIKALGEHECIYRVEPLDHGKVRVTKRIAK